MKIERISAPPVVQPPDTIVLTLTQGEYNELVVGYGTSSRVDREDAAKFDYKVALAPDSLEFFSALRKQVK